MLQTFSFVTTGTGTATYTATARLYKSKVFYILFPKSTVQIKHQLNDFKDWGDQEKLRVISIICVYVLRTGITSKPSQFPPSLETTGVPLSSGNILQ